MDVNQVTQLVNQAISERSDLFLVSCKVSASNDIHIEIDGDSGASLDDCMMVSRFVENSFDREVVDFALTVTTPDVTKPLSLPRQYQKNIGRVMQIRTDDVQIEGKLTAIEDEHLILEYKARVPKEVGKGKMTITKQDRIKIDSIKQSKVKIVFNA